MLASISRVVARQTQRKLLPSGASKSAPRPRTVASKAQQWRSSVLRKYTTDRAAELRAAGVPEEGFTRAFDLGAIARTVTDEMPSDDDFAELAKNFNELPDSRAAAPPSVSNDPETIHFNKTLRSLSNRNQYDVLLLKFLQSNQNGIVPDCESFVIILDAMTDRGHFFYLEAIDGLLEKIRIIKTPDLITAIMRMCAASGNSKRASQAFKQLLTESKFTPTIRTIEYYMIAHAKTKDHFPIVLDCFKQYPAKWNLTPDADFHGAFIEALLLNDREEVALKRWEAMKSGKLPYPTNKAIQVMLNFYASKEDYAMVDQLFMDINTKYGLFPDRANCATFLSCKMKLGKSEEATRIIERQAAESWRVEPTIMFELMEEFSQSGKRDLVEKLWALCPKVGVEPNQRALLSIVAACCADSRPDRALAYMSIAQDKYQVGGNRHIYAVLISTYGTLKDLSKALTLYRRMALEEKIMPGPTTFIALIVAYASNDEYEAILRMLQNPTSHGIPKQNRHHFETAIAAIEDDEELPLVSLLSFDWSRLDGVTTESPQELANLTRQLQATYSEPAQTM